jgi:hypothetical protein
LYGPAFPILRDENVATPDSAATDSVPGLIEPSAGLYARDSVTVAFVSTVAPLLRSVIFTLIGLPPLS